MPFAPHTLQSAPEASRAAMHATAERFGAVPDAVARLATSPQLLNTFLAGTAAVEDTSLSPLAREVAVMTVAVRHDCATCIGIHTAALRRHGGADLVSPLRERRTLGDPAMEAVRMFTEQVFLSYGQVPDSELEAFLAAGHTEQNALEIVMVAGIYTMSTFANRLVGA